jgi:hypothetical protein
MTVWIALASIAISVLNILYWPLFYFFRARHW